MKNFKTLTIILLVAVYALWACDSEMKNELEAAMNASDSIRLKAATLPTEWEVARYYAPWIVQDVDISDGWCSGHSKTGSADWITSVNYDGDWDATNNWDNLVSKGRDKGNLKGFVYFNFARTASHWYIIYHIYHPRDWDDFLCGTGEHENDMESILVCAERSNGGTGFGNVVYVSSIFHSDKNNYTRSQLKFSGAQPKMFIQSKGHGIRKYDGSADEDGTHIIYTEGDTNTQPDADGDALPQNCNYRLKSLDNLWNNRNQPNLFTDDLKKFKGNGSNPNAATAPWAFGDFTRKPAHYVKNNFSVSNWDTNYEVNRYRDRF